MTDKEAFQRYIHNYFDEEWGIDIAFDAFHEGLKHARSTAPAWHDAPNAPGLWVSSVWVARDFRASDIDTLKSYRNSPRWYGPLPEDKQ